MLHQQGLARGPWEQFSNLAPPPSTAGPAATAVLLHSNIPARGYADNSNVTFLAAMSDVVKHFPSFSSLYDHESWFLGADNWGNQTVS